MGNWWHFFSNGRTGPMVVDDFYPDSKQRMTRTWPSWTPAPSMRIRSMPKFRGPMANCMSTWVNQAVSIGISPGWWCYFTILKNMSQWVPDDIPYMKWKIIHSCLNPPTSNCIEWDMYNQEFLLGMGLSQLSGMNHGMGWKILFAQE